MINNVFDWYKYYKLADSYKNSEDVAKIRTAIGRFYYSSFLESRDHLLENKIFLNSVNEKIMKSTSGRVHQETRLTFKNHPQLSQNNAGAKIAQSLNVLRKYRNIADFQLPQPVEVVDCELFLQSAG